MALTIKRFLPVTILAVLVLLFVFENVGLVNNQVDDAYISYRYANNFAHGMGLVFNQGERVEGYTNLSWVLLVTLGIKLGFAADAVGYGLSMVFSIALLLATWFYTRMLLLPDREWLAPLAPMILLASNAFAMWSTSGLESPLFALLAVCGFIATRASRRNVVVLCCILAVFTRPDGVLLAAILLGIPLLQAIGRQRLGALRWVYWRESVLFAAACLALTLWRLYYYGEFVPNTYYAKVGGVPLVAGLKYIWEFLFDGAIFLVPPFVVAVYFVRGLLLEVLFLALVLLYCYAVAGDVFPFSRFFLPVLPLLAGVATLGIAAAIPRSKPLATFCVLCAAGSLAWFVYGPTMEKYTMKLDFSQSTLSSPAKRAQAKAWRNAGSFESVRKNVSNLKTIVNDDSLIAALAIGRLGYLIENPILDVLGLTDKTISHSDTRIKSTWVVPGHQRTNADYVFSMSPEVILIPRKGSTPLVLPVLADIWSNEQLKNYTYDDKIMGYRKLHSPAQ
jgi:hypothetical protein